MVAFLSTEFDIFDTMGNRHVLASFDAGCAESHKSFSRTDNQQFVCQRHLLEFPREISPTEPIGIILSCSRGICWTGLNGSFQYRAISVQNVAAATALGELIQRRLNSGWRLRNKRSTRAVAAAQVLLRLPLSRFSRRYGPSDQPHRP